MNGNRPISSMICRFICSLVCVIGLGSQYTYKHLSLCIYARHSFYTLLQLILCLAVCDSLVVRVYIIFYVYAHRAFISVFVSAVISSASLHIHFDFWMTRIRFALLLWHLHLLSLRTIETICGKMTVDVFPYFVSNKFKICIFGHTISISVFFREFGILV